MRSIWSSLAILFISLLALSDRGRCGKSKITEKIPKIVGQNNQTVAVDTHDALEDDSSGEIQQKKPSTTAATIASEIPNKSAAPEDDNAQPITSTLIYARKITVKDWNLMTGGRVVPMNDLNIEDILEPRNIGFQTFSRRDLDVEAANMVVYNNSTDVVNATSNDNVTESGGGSVKRHAGNEDDPKKKENDDGQKKVPPTASTFGIYMVTGVVVAICVVGLFAIFCVARANGQRARDYEFNARRRTERQQQMAAASGWRRSQDYLNNESASRVVEDRSAAVDAASHLGSHHYPPPPSDGAQMTHFVDGNGQVNQVGQVATNQHQFLNSSAQVTRHPSHASQISQASQHRSHVSQQSVQMKGVVSESDVTDV